MIEGRKFSKNYQPRGYKIHTLGTWNNSDVADACFCSVFSVSRWRLGAIVSLAKFIDKIILFRIFRKRKLLIDNEVILLLVRMIAAFPCFYSSFQESLVQKVITGKITRSVGLLFLSLGYYLWIVLRSTTIL